MSVAEYLTAFTIVFTIGAVFIVVTLLSIIIMFGVLNKLSDKYDLF